MSSCKGDYWGKRGVRTWEGVEAGEWTCRQTDRSRAKRTKKREGVQRRRRGRERMCTPVLEWAAALLYVAHT